jgi:hypothetical protein
MTANVTPIRARRPLLPSDALLALIDWAGERTVSIEEQEGFIDGYRHEPSPTRIAYVAGLAARAKRDGEVTT